MKAQFIRGAMIIALSTASHYAMSQGWVANSSNQIYTVNDTLNQNPVSVLIGTDSPTAQLHTTGSVRFANLLPSVSANQILATDATGNLFWRDAASFGTQNSWLLNGNGSTTAANFLGTTDNNKLSIRTNNLERMVLLADGNVGVGVSNPELKFQIHSTIKDNNLHLSGIAPSIRFSDQSVWGSSSYLGRIGLAQVSSDFVLTSRRLYRPIYQS